MISRFGTADQIALKKYVATALMQKGIFLADLGRNDEAIASIREIPRRFEQETDARLRAKVEAASATLRLAATNLRLAVDAARIGLGLVED